MVNYKHGMRKSKLYSIWLNMRKRCEYQKCKDYPQYGGRGISIDIDWKLFENFYRDVGDVPEGMTLDRINVNGNYEKSNCRWATMKTQERNRRNNRILDFNGESLCVSEWAERMGVTASVLFGRLHRGWSIEKTLSSNRSDNDIF